MCPLPAGIFIWSIQMPQYPIVAQEGGTQTTFNLTADTVIKPTPGRVFTISVIVAGTVPGAVYDSTNTTDLFLTNQTAVIPNTQGVINMNAFPHNQGIVISPGPGQTVSVAWS
jgi:hypothetical protein